MTDDYDKTRTLTQKLLDELHGMDACEAARAWVLDKGIETIAEAWEKCDHPDWMVWLLALAHAEWRRIGADLIDRAFLCQPSIPLEDRLAVGAALIDLLVKDMCPPKTPSEPTTLRDRGLRAVHYLYLSSGPGGPTQADGVTYFLERVCADLVTILRELVSSEEIAARWAALPHDDPHDEASDE